MKKYILNKTKLILGFAACSLFFASCEDKVQIKLEAKGKVLTVDAFLNSLRENQKIRLTYTDSYFSGSKPAGLTGATVIVKDLSNNKTYTFIDNANGNYIYNLATTDTIIYQNHNYELNVKQGGYEYKATTKCKRSTAILGLFFEYKDEVKVNGTVTENAGNQLRLLAVDSTGNDPDFYWVKIFRNGVFYNRPENMFLEAFGNINEFDGQLFFEEKWVTSSLGVPEKALTTGEIARLEIHGISRETFDFLTIGQNMSSNGGLFATTPVNLPTNIIPVDNSYPKSVGMFSVSDVTFDELIAP